jgi:glycosyltransferase involved in cell wall biosynthesis
MKHSFFEDKPLFSVLIPVHNEEKYITSCLKSIQRQTFTNWEAVILDDGSTDGTAEIVRRISSQDSRIRYFHQPASGLIEALNHGLKQCVGKYLARIDGDDLMPRNLLQEQFDILESQGESTLVTGRVRYFPRGGENAEIKVGVGAGYRQYETWLNSLQGKDFLFNALKECPVAAPAWSAPLNAVRDLGFTPGIYPEDYHFMLRALKSGWKFYHSDTPALWWRHHSERLSLNSEDYALNKFWKVKAIHFQGLLKRIAPNRKIWILGSGDSAKNFIRALKENTETLSLLEGIISIHPHKKNREYEGLKIISWEKREQFSGDFFAVAVGRYQEQVRKELKKSLRYREGRDYLFLC